MTSLFLAKETGAKVFATDLWISATDNNVRFNEWGISENVVPIHADANDLPFSNEYFDAVVAIDSLHYVAAQPHFIDKKVLSLIKPNGVVIIAMPGLKKEIHGINLTLSENGLMGKIMNIIYGTAENGG